ncbi:tubulin folding cofactor D C terminal-domain-containing protein [Xylariomycetidae sp. FL2044]|nr:tubulin folding cofactor D C terminal-domain-containing protein [Xylariomycetidae sp. FL2044]
MDASEQDRDVLIQKYSADLIADFDRSLGPFLKKPNGQLRRRVRMRETLRLISHVLDPFQELPQLLDPHLPKWLPVLAEAYLGSLQDRRRNKSLSLRSQLLDPLPSSICRILYTFCKIRGEKVIVRFLNVETRHLELLLLAIEESERDLDPSAKHNSALSWSWQERYIVLLWLSQLFFAPFDLSTISSGDMDDADRPDITGFQWPSQVPGITLRVIPLAIKYLSRPGKERDGAKALLVRVAMRKDMQELGTLGALVQWALSTLRPTKDATVQSPYFYIGSLSFLAGVLAASADTSIMDPYLSSIFYTCQAIPAEDNAIFNVINGSALARKMMIKVTRSVATLVLRKREPSMAESEMVETSIGYLLERLADNDTPVRLAASKALSVITLKLESDMASQVIEAVLDSLNRNVLWVKNKTDPAALSVRDLTAVDPLEWHGLMLTLSHLLYRRSPPPDDLSDIIHALLLGLAFEKRNPSGGSIGTNVRDAACFGIWALARRYSTTELLRVQTQSVLVAKGHDPGASIIQVIATELVVTASLDPAGNIRRGASAALQELIGRHPDTVEEGITVVQVVDYHAVALRSRAIHEVALQATLLSSHYGHALLEATLGWRGIGDMDAAARRVAATSFGKLTAALANIAESGPYDRLQRSLELLLSRLEQLQVRQVEERHGLLLSLAAVLDEYPPILKKVRTGSDKVPVTRIYGALQDIIQASHETKYRKPELIAEAAGRLVVSSTPILLMSLAEHRPISNLYELVRSGPEILTESESDQINPVAGLITSFEDDRPKRIGDLLAALEDAVTGWLDRNEAEVLRATSEAALVLLLFSSGVKRGEIIKVWCDKVIHSRAPRNTHGDGYFHALTRAYPLTTSKDGASQQELIENPVGEALMSRWGRDEWVETRVAILQSLVDRVMLKVRGQDFMDIIAGGLDDYTTTARGDIGSHVRLEALKATKTLWGAQDIDRSIISILYPRVLRLAAEKLDRVRAEAQSTLTLILQDGYSEQFGTSTFSSKEYFATLFHLCGTGRLRQPTATETLDVELCTSVLLAGLVTSADTGNEDLVIASRAALAEFCEESPDNLSRVCKALVNNLRHYQAQSQDRVVVPTLEVLAYLFHVGLCPGPRADALDLKTLCLLVQKAAYKTGNVRKLEACIRVYGGIAGTSVLLLRSGGGEGETMSDHPARKGRQEEGMREARRRLGALMLHPWPRVRSLVVDELWGQGLLEGEQGHREQLLGVDWARAEKPYIKNMVAELGLA